MYFVCLGGEWIGEGNTLDDVVVTAEGNDDDDTWNPWNPNEDDWYYDENEEEEEDYNGGGNTGNNSEEAEESYFEENLEEFVVDLDFQQTNVTDLQSILYCFSNALATATFELTIYVDQPIPNSDDTWENQGTLFSPNIDVGHTFISLNMNDNGSQTIQTFGFYPANGVDPMNPSTNGAWLNDGGHHYDVSATVSLTHSQFMALINNISNQGTPTYNLNTLNCSDAALDICNSTGIMNLPDTAGSWPGGGGTNPGNLGQDIRNLNNSNVNVNTNGGTAPSSTNPSGC